MSDKVLKIVSRYIYDSRGNPTVEVDVWTSKGRERLLHLRNDPVSLLPYLAADYHTLVSTSFHCS